MSENKVCPCCSGKDYDECCGRFLDQGKVVKTPEQLMRSRYTAYCQGGRGEYLLETWFPITAQGLSVPELSLRHRDWKKLEVLAKSQQGDSGTVEFKAYFKPLNKPDAELEHQHERSSFQRVQGKWFYVGEEVS